MAYLGLEVVHSRLDHGNEAFELLAHGLTQNILFLLYVEALHAHLGLVSHAADELVCECSTLPLSRLLAKVLCEQREEADNLGLSAQVLEERVERILGRLLDGGSLVCHQVERQGYQALLLDEEDGLCDALRARESLEESAEGVHGALSLDGILLVGGRFLDLVDYAIATKAAEADRVLQEGGECIGGVDRGVRRLCCDDAGDKGADVLLRGCRTGAGLVDDDSRSHGWRFRVRHLLEGNGALHFFFGSATRDFFFGGASLSISGKARGWKRKRRSAAWKKKTSAETRVSNVHKRPNGRVESLYNTEKQ
jgi:hypothetical protein